MKKYGKIVLGALQVPQNYPCSIVTPNGVINNPTEEELIAAGYMPVRESEPEEMEGMTATAEYSVEEGEIVQRWSYEPTPEDGNDMRMHEEEGEAYII